MSVEVAPQAIPLQKDEHCNGVVMGSGIAGLSTALGILWPIITSYFGNRSEREVPGHWPRNDLTSVAALYLGKRDLVYMGKVGTGWARTASSQIRKQLDTVVNPNQADENPQET